MTRKLFIGLLLSFALPLALLAQPNDDAVMRVVDNLILNAEYQRALEHLDQASTGGSSLLLQIKRAETLTRLGAFPETEHLLTRIYTRLALHPDPLLKALTQTNHGFLQLNQGRTDLAEETLQNALRTFETSGDSSGPEAAHAYAHLGIVYMTQGKYTQAQEHLHRALSLRQSQKNITQEWIAATYNDLGLVYSQTDKEKALDYYEEATRMYAALYGGRHPKIAIAHINTGIVYRDLELFGDAIENFENALSISNEVYSGSHPAKAIALYNLGQTYLQQNDHTAAMAYYRQALEMYEDTYGGIHPEVVSVLNAIGNLQLAGAAFDDALRTYHRALQANVHDFTNNDIETNPGLNNYYNGTGLLHTLLFKAQAFETKYLRKSLKFSDLQESLRILLKCDSLIDILRHESSHESDKLLLGAVANEVYGDGVRIAYEAASNAVRKEPYLERAFYFAEKSKSAVLLESISDAQAKAFAGIPADLLEEEKRLRSAMTFNAQRLSLKPAPDEERLLREGSFDLKRRYDAFIQKLEDEYPSYFNLKYNSSTPSVGSIQDLISDSTALISYAADEQNDQLYIFVVRKKQFKVWKRSLPADFGKYITGLRNSLYFVEINTFGKSATALAEILLPRLPASVTDLIILPTGRLALIPFETLLLKNPDNIGDFASMPYLIKQYSVRYEFAAGLFLQKAQTPASSRTDPSIMLCAPVNFPQRPYLGELPGTEREVHEITALFKDRDFAFSAFIRQDADEEMIKSKDLKDYGFLHFATHGVVDETQPERSRIFLQSGTPAEDGELFAGEIYNLELKANLVTLSACQTGLGKILKGEGVIGLSRALVYAGARNVVVSYWNVADESTAMFMKTFYGHVLNASGAHNYTNALRQAKRNLIQSKKYAAPFYWAPFVLIGN